MLNEVTYYMVACFFLAFTNFNPDPMAKLIMGWVIVGICVCNLIWPNGYMMVSSIWPDIKAACTCTKTKKQRKASVKLEEYREDLISRYNL